MDNHFDITIAPHPLKHDIVQGVVHEGVTLGELGVDSGIQAVVDGEIVTDCSYRPKAGQIVLLQRMARGQGGDRIIAQLAVIVIATIVAGPAGFGTATQMNMTAFAITSLIGNLAINALIPPPDLSMDQSGGFEPFRSISNTRNQFGPFETIPMLYGKQRVFPFYASRPSNALSGRDDYFTALFCVGYRPMNIDKTTIKVGDALLSTYEDVTVHAVDGFLNADAMSIVDIVSTDYTQADLKANDELAIRTTAVNTKAIVFDIQCAPFISYWHDDYDKGNLIVGFTFEYRNAGSMDPWVVIEPTVDSATGETEYVSNYPDGVTILTGQSFNAPNEQGPALAFQGRTTDSGILSARVTFPSPGQYEVRITRRRWYSFDGLFWEGEGNQNTGADGNFKKAYEDFVLFRSKSILNATQTINSKYAYIAVRMRATTQLSGALDELSCIAQSVLPVASGTYSRTGTTITVTIVGHGLANNDPVLLDFTSGAGSDGTYLVTVTGADTFTVVDAVSGTTSGNVSMSRPTSNPAHCFKHVLTGPPNKRPIATAKIDDAGLNAWRDRCAAAGREFNGYINAKITVYEALKMIAAVGRAAMIRKDGLYSVAEDRAGLTPIQMFTPRNSWDLQANRTFNRLPHALKVKFKNRDADWKEDERVVYSDGYSLAGNKLGTYVRSGTLITVTLNNHELVTGVIANLDFTSGAGSDGQYIVTVIDANTFTVTDSVSGATSGDVTLILTTASRFESVSLFGVDNKNQAWSDARFMLANGVLRPETFVWKCAIENLIALRGDVVRLQHDAILVGLGSGRIVSATTTSVTCDEEFEVENGKTYQIYIRDVNNVVLIRTITNTAGTHKTLNFGTTVVVNDVVGALLAFGESGLVTIDVIVTGIRPLDDLTAEITATPYSSPAIHNADGTIPAYTTGITFPPTVPEAPTIVSVSSAVELGLRTIEGGFIPRVIVGYTVQQDDLMIVAAELQYAKSEAVRDWKTVKDSFTGTISFIPDVLGTYDLRLRVWAFNGFASEWVLSEDYVIEVAPSTTAYITLSEITNTPATSDGRNSTIRATITPPSPIGNWDHAVIKYRKQGTLEWFEGGQGTAEIDTVLTADGSTYEFAVINVSTSQVRTEGSDDYQVITLKNLVGSPPNGSHIATYLPAVAVTNLKLANDGDLNFDGRDAFFEWDNGAIPTYLHFKDYLVRIKRASDDVVLRTEYVTAARYRYTYEMNQLDHGVGAPVRTFKIEVLQRTLQGNLGP